MHAIKDVLSDSSTCGSADGSFVSWIDMALAVFKDTEWSESDRSRFIERTLTTGYVHQQLGLFSGLGTLPVVVIEECVCVYARVLS